MTIALSGRLDTVTAPELELEISNALAGITELILDLENSTTFLPRGFACCFRRRRR